MCIRDRSIYSDDDDDDDDDMIFQARKKKPVDALGDKEPAKKSPEELYAGYIEAGNTVALSSIPAEYITNSLIEVALRKNNPVVLGILLQKKTGMMM